MTQDPLCDQLVEFIATIEKNKPRDLFVASVLETLAGAMINGLTRELAEHVIVFAHEQLRRAMAPYN